MSGAPSIPLGAAAPLGQLLRQGRARPQGAIRTRGHQAGVGVLAEWPGPQFLYLQSGVTVPSPGAVETEGLCS